ncbi:chalcone isomerase family protein, partial [Roseburia hominis]|nr:chalcone isomerase family protein [Roseburia hominis]
LIFKVYTIALYLPEKKSQLAEILALPGPRRLEIVMLRDISSDDLGKSFMEGLNRSSDQADRTRLLSQTMQLGTISNMA